MKDLQQTFPNACEGKVKGYLAHNIDPTPVMTVDAFQAWVHDSECRAHTLHLECAQRLRQSKDCEQAVQDHIDVVRAELDEEGCAAGADSSSVPAPSP